MTEEEYWTLLNELDFDVSEQGNPRPNVPNGRALRHLRIELPARVRGRKGEAADAFWPTLYWNRSRTGLIYFATCSRDLGEFDANVWEPVAPPLVRDDADGFSFVPRRQGVAGARAALRSLLER